MTSLPRPRASFEEKPAPTRGRCFRVAGAELRPDITGALFWPERRLMVVSDLHLEKGSAFAARGLALPPYDTRATLRRIEVAAARLKPETIISLGDSFHDRRAGSRIAPSDRLSIRSLTERFKWIWITGNHDPEPPRDLGGTVTAEFDAGPLTFRHEPREAPATGEIAGHLHPCGVVRVRGRRLRRRCFLTDGTRVVMPAFGAYAGGLNVLDEAYRSIVPKGGFHAWMMGAEEIVPVAARTLLPDPS